MKRIYRILAALLLSVSMIPMYAMKTVTKESLEISFEGPSKEALFMTLVGIASYKQLKSLIHESAGADLDEFYDEVQRAMESIIDDSKLMPSKLDSIDKNPFERRCHTAWQDIQHAFNELVRSLREKTSNADSICIQLVPTLNTILSVIGSQYTIYLDLFDDMKNDAAHMINHVDLHMAIVNATQAVVDNNDQVIISYRITKTKDIMFQCLYNDIAKAKSKIRICYANVYRVGMVTFCNAVKRAYYRIMLQFCVR